MNQPAVPPLGNADLSDKPGERIIDKPELPAQGVLMQLVADTETVPGQGMVKVGKARGFTIYSDEGSAIGGTGKYPPPMPMLAAAVGF